MRFFNRISFQTPESVELDFTLAGIGNRAYALVIDYIVLGLVLIIFLIFWGFLSFYTLELFSGDTERNIGLWLFAIQLIIIFTFYVGYFVIFETLWQGQTPGKKRVKIRVIRDDGRIIGISQATLRALLRPVDDLLSIGAFLIIFSPKEKRIGDIVAGTIVIQEKTVNKTNIFQISNQASSLASFLQIKADIAQLLPEDFAIIREYLERREEMLTEARIKTSNRLANQVKEIINLEQVPENVSANLFLEATYLAYQQYHQTSLNSRLDGRS
jgi:uncharacterized RDD family membrane protein YckC